MTTQGTLAPVMPTIELRPPRARLRRSSLVWALTATHFVSRAGGVARSFLVLYLTQERHLSPTMAGAVVAAVGVGDIGSQLLGGRRCRVDGGAVPPGGITAVADLPAQERVRAYGLLFWAANLGFTVSTVAAGVLVQQGYGILFWINAAASVLAALIVWRHVPETRPSTPKATRRALLPVLLRDRVMLAMAAIHVVYFAVLGPLLGTALLDHAGRTALWAACTATGLALFVAQHAVAPALRRRTSAPAYNHEGRDR